MTTLPNDPSANIQQAKSRLETAMARLERALETRAERVAVPRNSEGNSEGAPSGELDAAREEIGRLKETNKVVSARLDAAIGRVKVLLAE